MAEITPITLPKWGLEMSEGTVTAWHLEEGGSADKGTELVDIETDKIVNSLELDKPGTLRRIVVPAGETVAVGTLIAVMAAPDLADDEIDRFIAGYQPIDASFEPKDKAAPATPQPEPEPAAPDTAATTDTPSNANGPTARATPLARRLATETGIDLTTIQGTGRKGRITREDVEKRVAGSPTAPAPDPEAVRAANAAVHASPIARRFADEIGLEISGIAGTGRKGRVSLADAQSAATAAGLWLAPVAEPRRSAPPVAAEAPRAPAEPGMVQPFTGMRKSIAKALVHSKQTVPHFYTTIDVDLDAALALRAEMNAAADEGAAKISVNDVLLRASAVALTKHPAVNVHVSDDGITAFPQVDIAMAVAIEGGLLTPVLRDVAQLGLRAIARASADLAARGRARSLEADDVAGGTFTLSNLGMYGVKAFDAIINPPQAAILAVGGSRREAREGGDGGLRFATVVSLTLSADHRAIDGALAASFLATMRSLIERPSSLLI